MDRNTMLNDVPPITVKKLREILVEGYSSSRYDDMPVVIESYLPSVGPVSTYGITSVYEGIDWDSGKLFLHSHEHAMEHYNQRAEAAAKNHRPAISFVIPLNPVTKKNSGQIVIDKRTGKKKLIPSQAFLQYSADASYFIRSHRIDTPVNVEAHYYMKTRNRVDLMNLNEALHDIMVERQCIIDDNSRIIVSTDGSRVHYDPQNPRTEVKITFLDDYEDPFEKPAQTKNKSGNRIIVDKKEFKKRQADGISRARARGVRFGAPRKPKPDNFEAVMQRYLAKEIASRQAAKELGIAQSTFLKWVKESDDNGSF